MANRLFDWFQVLGKKRVDITGSFQPNGSATNVVNVRGNGFTVTHTAGSSQYNVYFQDAYPGYDSAWVEFQGAVGYTAFITQDVDTQVTQRMIIQLYDSSTKTQTGQTDLPFNSIYRIHFGIRMKNTTGNF